MDVGPEAVLAVVGFSPGWWTVAKGRKTAPTSIAETLECRLGNEWLVALAENGEPSLAGTVCEVVKPVVVGRLADPVKDEPGCEASKSSCRFVRGTNKLSWWLESVELNSTN